MRSTDAVTGSPSSAVRVASGPPPSSHSTAAMACDQADVPVPVKKCPVRVRALARPLPLAQRRCTGERYGIRCGLRAGAFRVPVRAASGPPPPYLEASLRCDLRCDFLGGLHSASCAVSGNRRTSGWPCRRDSKSAQRSLQSSHRDSTNRAASGFAWVAFGGMGDVLNPDTARWTRRIAGRITTRCDDRLG